MTELGYDSKQDNVAQKEKKYKPIVWDSEEEYWKATKPAEAAVSSRNVSPLSTTSARNRVNMRVQSPFVYRKVCETRGSALLEKVTAGTKQHRNAWHTKVSGPAAE
jgi:hypothetical protein